MILAATSKVLEGLAGMQVWMITGDKQETAINIAIACKLVHHIKDLLIVNAHQSEEAARARLQDLLALCRASSPSAAPGTVSVQAGPLGPQCHMLLLTQCCFMGMHKESSDLAWMAMCMPTFLNCTAVPVGSMPEADHHHHSAHLLLISVQRAMHRSCTALR